MAKKKIQRRKMAPRAVALLAGIALLLAVIVIFVSGRQMRNNGRRYARKLGEQIGMSVATAAEAAKVEFVNASAYPSVTRAAGTPYLFESPKTTEANGATLPQWVIFCNAVNDTVFAASRCLQCGCCLEVCPNFCCGGTFMGMNGVALFNRILTETDRADYEKAAKQYQKHIFEGCGKSLACRDICPKKIDTEKMMVNANALAVWKRRKKL